MVVSLSLLYTAQLSWQSYRIIATHLVGLLDQLTLMTDLATEQNDTAAVVSSSAAVPNLHIINTMHNLLFQLHFLDRICNALQFQSNQVAKGSVIIASNCRQLPSMFSCRGEMLGHWWWSLYRWLLSSWFTTSLGSRGILWHSAFSSRSSFHSTNSCFSFNIAVSKPLAFHTIKTTCWLHTQTSITQ